MKKHMRFGFYVSTSALGGYLLTHAGIAWLYWYGVLNYLSAGIYLEEWRVSK